MRYVILLVCLFSNHAFAQFETGQRLVLGFEAAGRMTQTSFRPGDPGEAGILIGYISGVADSYMNTDWCPTTQITVDQLMRVVAKYLDNNPNKLGMSAAWIVYVALKESFPCAPRIQQK